MNAPSTFLDERCRADLDDLAAARSMSRAAVARVAGSIAGLGGLGHDRIFMVGSTVLHLLAAPTAPAHRRDALVAFCLDPALTRRHALTEALRMSVGADAGITIGDDGLDVAMQAASVRLRWTPMLDSLALLNFMLVADSLDHFGEIAAGFADVQPEQNLRQHSVAQLARALARVAYRYRNNHFPERDVMRRHHGLLAFMARRTRPGARWRFDDATILDCWRHLCAEGERPLFEATARQCHAVERAMEYRAARHTIATASGADTRDRDALEMIAAGDEGPLDGYGDTTPGLAAVVASVPDTPKVLNGTERDLLMRIARLEPLHRDRALTVLRALVFGRLQIRLSRPSSADGGPARATSYHEQMTACTDLRNHLLNVALLLAETSGMAGQHPERTFARATRIRRQGFERPREELAAALTVLAGPLATMIEELRTFVVGAGDAAAMYERDRPVFAAVFEQLYPRQMVAG